MLAGRIKQHLVTRAVKQQTGLVELILIVLDSNDAVVNLSASWQRCVIDAIGFINLWQLF